MKQIFLCLLLSSLSIGVSAASPQGKVIEGQSMTSQITGYAVNYSVYLPPCYDSSERAYPVVYLLHGYTDSETAWVQFGEVNRVADEAIASEEIPPMIIVMPDAKVTWYVNNHTGTDKYEDMMIEEFIPFVEKQYRIRSDRSFRGVSGLSMGGNGSLVYALRHPDVFGVCAPFSAAVYTNEEVIGYLKNDQKQWFTSIYGDLGENDQLPQHWMEYSVLEMINRMPAKEISQVKFYIDCGDDDFLYKGNAALHVALRDKGVEHQFRIREGAHNWTYWRGNIIHGLKFMGDAFHR